MSSRTFVLSRLLPRAIPLFLAAAAVTAIVSVAWAGVGAFRNSAVGGVSINADGILGPPDLNARNLFLDELRKQVKQPSGDLNATVPLRMFSLRQLVSACQDALKNNFGQLPDEVKFLGGIQRIQYVFAYPEEHDIVIAGPGEGWKVDDRANVVGVTTGRPVLRIDDLLVAFRSVHDARTGGITCSIDPTEEGRRAFENLMQQERRQRGPRNTLAARVKQAFGLQKITIAGVPATSHFARVLSAADYRMKRLAMDLEPSPVDSLPSYLDLIQRSGTRTTNATPRWWLACNYDPLATTEDRLAWELRGPGVKVMTEDDFVSTAGQVRHTGKASPLAQKWADLMTNSYDALSVREPVFGELRNLMDFCVVAALLEKEGLWDRAGIDARLLRDAAADLKLEVWNAPKAVAPEVSFMAVREGLVVTASGGVQVDSWQIASRVEVAPQVGQIRKKATPGGKSLCWQ